MVFGNLEGFLHPLTDSNARYYDNELCPAISFVEFKHRLDIDISLSCAGFHLNIECDTPEVVAQCGGDIDIVGSLNGLQVIEQFWVGKAYLLVGIALHGMQDTIIFYALSIGCNDIVSTLVKDILL